MRKSNNIIMLMLAFILVMGLASASIDNIENVKKGECISLIQQNEGVSYETLASILLPDKTFIIINDNMTSQGSGFYNYSFCNTTQLGKYFVNGFDTDGSWNYYFDVTKNGEEKPTTSMLIFTYILFIIAIFGTILTFFLTIAKMATISETIYGVLVACGFYILLLIVYFLGSNYIYSNFIEDNAGLILTICAFTNVLLPLFSLILTIFYKSSEKKRPLSVQELTGGYGYAG